jgi:thiamine-phosphate pyrophosphorylase
MAAHAAARVTRAQRAARLRGIYAIVNESERAPEVAKGVLDAGVCIVQYRAKHGVVAERLVALRALTHHHDALLIVNDDARAAKDFGCDGVHLGPGDAGFSEPAALRAALGELLVGLSCGTVEEARLADAAGVDYIGVGSVYATGSKADAGEPIGLEGLTRVASATSLPVAAIGGIGAANLPQIRSSGVAMAAVISAVAGSDPYRAARELVALWNA